MINKRNIIIFLIIIFVAGVWSNELQLPTITIGAKRAENPQETATAIKIVLLLTILSLAPSILIMTTCFTRIIIIFHFIRQAIGTQNMPPNQILVGLALFLSFYIMSPTYTKIYHNSYKPYMTDSLSQDSAMSSAGLEIKKFMLKQVREDELALFLKLSNSEKLYKSIDTPLSVVIPAFILSELKIAFQIGFILYLPFIIIDMVIASILMSMGMMMLPPMMISLPFKILLFVLVDGWYLLVESIIEGFH